MEEAQCDDRRGAGTGGHCHRAGRRPQPRAPAAAACRMQHREVLVLREIEEMDYRQIAALTNVPDRHGDVAAGPRPRCAQGAVGGSLRGRRAPCALNQSACRRTSTASWTRQRRRSSSSTWPRCAACRARAGRPGSRPRRTARALCRRACAAGAAGQHPARAGCRAGPVAPGAAAAVSWRTRPFWLGLLGGVGGSAVAAALAFLLLFAPQVEPAGPARRRPRPLPDPWPPDRRGLDRPAHGQALVRRPRRCLPGGGRFCRPGLPPGGRAHRCHRAASARRWSSTSTGRTSSMCSAGRPRAGRRRPTPRAAATTWRSGRPGDLMYCAVSDTGWSELQGLEQLLKAAGERELHP